MMLIFEKLTRNMSRSVIAYELSIRTLIVASMPFSEMLKRSGDEARFQADNEYVRPAVKGSALSRSAGGYFLRLR